MSSSGECELDGETPPVSPLPVVAPPPPKMAEQPHGKKVVYTRKKSTSAMQQRKISADKSHWNAEQQTAAGALPTDNSGGQRELGMDKKNVSSDGKTFKSATEQQFLALPSPFSALASRSPATPARPHYHRHHHHSASSSHNQSSNNTSLRKHVLVRRSPSPSMSPGYEQYQMALLEVPLPRDYGEASSDDLSSEWDSDAPDSRPNAFFGNFKVKWIDEFCCRR